MTKLVQNDECSIIFGDFKGELNQELFRCPRALDNTDLREYVNTNRCFLGFEADNETTDLTVLKNSPYYLGYYRLYFRNGSWYGKWLEESDELDRIVCHGVDEIVAWLQTRFPQGCNWDMEAYLERYPAWGSDDRYLLKPIMSDKYKVMFDTTYGNGDYPVRIYVIK